MTLRIFAHCADRCVVTLNEPGKPSREHVGYVPAIIPGGPGDQVDLLVDVMTGRILNWVIPTHQETETTFSKEENGSP